MEPELRELVNQQLGEQSPEALEARVNEFLGPKLAEYVSGGGEDVDLDPHERADRITTTAAMISMLTAHDARETVLAWFVGMNPMLDDLAPAEVVRQGGLFAALEAARAFVVTG